MPASYRLKLGRVLNVVPALTSMSGAPVLSGENQTRAEAVPAVALATNRPSTRTVWPVGTAAADVDITANALSTKRTRRPVDRPMDTARVVPSNAWRNLMFAAGLAGMYG